MPVTQAGRSASEPGTQAATDSPAEIQRLDRQTWILVNAPPGVCVRTYGPELEVILILLDKVFKRFGSQWKELRTRYVGCNAT